MTNLQLEINWKITCLTYYFNGFHYFSVSNPGACYLIVKRLVVFNFISIRICQRLYYIRNILWMCYRIHIERTNENLRSKNQMLIRIEFFKAFLALSCNPHTFQTCKSSKKGKKRLLLSGSIYTEDHFSVDAIFSYILYVKDNGLLFHLYFYSL